MAQNAPKLVSERLKIKNFSGGGMPPDTPQLGQASPAHRSHQPPTTKHLLTPLLSAGGSHSSKRRWMPSRKSTSPLPRPQTFCAINLWNRGGLIIGDVWAKISGEREQLKIPDLHYRIARSLWILVIPTCGGDIPIRFGATGL